MSGSSAKITQIAGFVLGLQKGGKTATGNVPDGVSKSASLVELEVPLRSFFHQLIFNGNIYQKSKTKKKHCGVKYCNFWYH